MSLFGDEMFGDPLETESPDFLSQFETTSSAAPREEEKQAEFTSPAATEQPERISNVEDQQNVKQLVTRDTAQRIETVIESPVILTLMEDGPMTPKQQSECREILGYAPPNLMDKRVQAAMIGRNPELRSAFGNSLTKTFAVGINHTSAKLAKSIMLAAVSRSLLNDTLARMGLGAEARDPLVESAIKIQRTLEQIAVKTQNFVLVMAQTMTSMGETAFALEYGADPNVLIQAIQETQMVVVAQSDGFSQENILGPIRGGIKLIKNSLQQSDAYKTKEELVQTREETWKAKERQLHEKYRTEFQAKAEMQAERQLLKLQMENNSQDVATKRAYIENREREIATLQQAKQGLERRQNEVRDLQFNERKVYGLRDISQLEANLDSDQVDLTQYEDVRSGQMDLTSLERDMKTRSQIPNHGADEMQRFRNSMRGMIQSEISSRQASLKKRISQLEEQQRQIESKSADLRSQAIFQSDGLTTIKRTTGKLYHYRQERIGQDRQSLYRRTADDMSTQLPGIRSELAQLRRNLEAIPAQVKKEMQAESSAREEQFRRNAEAARREAAFLEEQKRKALQAAEERNRRIREENEARQARLSNLNSSIVRRNQEILRKVQDQNTKLIGIARNQFIEDQQRALETLRKQISAVSSVIQTTDTNKANCYLEMRQVEQVIEQQSGRDKKLKEDLKQHEEEKGGIKEEIASLEAEEKFAKRKYDEAYAELESMQRKFGIQNGTDFASFMQIFSLLDVSMQNLPAAMKMLSKSFEAAMITLGGDFFRKRILSIPESQRGKALSRVAQDMQNLCEIGWKMFDAPMDSLIHSDAAAILDPFAVEARKRRALGALDTSGPIIEEVEENSGKPPLAIQAQEENERSRRR